MIEKIFKLYSQDVYYYILSLCKNPTLSEDLTSETFYQVMLSLPTFQGKSALKTWIFSIARHVTYSELKKRKIEIDIDGIREMASYDSYSCLHDEILGYMKTQSQVSQDVLNLRLEGYSFEEIAEKLHINSSSARVIQHRNKQYLKEKLERRYDDEDKL